MGTGHLALPPPHSTCPRLCGGPRAELGQGTGDGVIDIGKHANGGALGALELVWEALGLCFPYSRRQGLSSTVAVAGEKADAARGDEFDDTPLGCDRDVRGGRGPALSPLLTPHRPHLHTAIEALQQRITLNTGQSYLIDNRRWLHARTGFCGNRVCLRSLGDPRTLIPPGFPSRIPWPAP